MQFVRTLDGQTFGELVLHEPFMKFATTLTPYCLCAVREVETFSIST